MKPIKPNRTESTFTSNKEVKRLAGHTDTKRDGVKDISIALYDVDYAVKWHLERVVKPTIVEENAIITVPILFAAGEKWTAVQKHGYLRDNQGKLLTPLIMIRRNSVSKREDIQDLKVLETADARITFEKQYSSKNRYDRFALTNKPVKKEYYSMDVPKFVQVEYDLLIWTNNSIQLNEVVEQLMWFDGKAFGDAHKFITHIDAPTFEAVNNTGEDRLVRASMAMRTKAQILNTHGPNAPSLYKITPVDKVLIGTEVDTAIPTTGAVPVTSTTTSINPGLIATYSPTVNAAMIYINTNKTLTGTIVSETTVTFNSGWVKAPSGLPATSVDNFMFFANGMLIERSSIVSFTQLNGVSTLVINPTQLSYSFVSEDEVLGIGKFLKQDSLA
jgi:hypothetical protein